MGTQREKPWFRVKRRGYGVGFPISWQGWAVGFTFVFAAILVGTALEGLAGTISILLVGGVFVLIAHQKSDAEWRWRNDN